MIYKINLKNEHYEYLVHSFSIFELLVVISSKYLLILFICSKIPVYSGS